MKRFVGASYFPGDINRTFADYFAHWGLTLPDEAVVPRVYDLKYSDPVKVRTLLGATTPKESAPGTIRGDLASETTENLVHGSDGPESAEREIGIFFPDL